MVFVKKKYFIIQRFTWSITINIWYDFFHSPRGSLKLLPIFIIVQNKNSTHVDWTWRIEKRKQKSISHSIYSVRGLKLISESMKRKKKVVGICLWFFFAKSSTKDLFIAEFSFCVLPFLVHVHKTHMSCVFLFCNSIWRHWLFLFVITFFNKKIN